MTYRPWKWTPLSAHNLSLILILAAGLLVRAKGISFGLPNTLCRPDEATIIETAWNVFSGDPNPHFFYYPSLYIYLLAGLFSLRYFALFLLEVPQDLLLAEMSTDPTPFFLIARSVSMLFGTATILFVYLVSRKLWSRSVALIAALFTSLCYLHVRDSHFATTDVTSTFFTIASVFFVMEAFEKERARDYIRAGVLAGMAASTKYGAMLVALPMLFAHVSLHVDRCHVSGQFDRFSRIRSSLLDRKIWSYVIAALGSFCFFTPFALLDYPTFAGHFHSEMKHLATGHVVGGVTLLLGHGWWYHFRYTLLYGMGPLMLASAIAGGLISLRKAPIRAFLVFLFPLAYYLACGKGYTVFVRYMIPTVPFLCMASAVLVAAIGDRIGHNPLRRIALFLLVLSLLLPSVGNVIRFDHLLSQRDNRLLVGDWLKNHVAPGKTVYQTGLPFGHVRLPSSLKPVRIQGGTSDSISDYLLVQEHPLPASKTTEFMLDLLKTDYHLLKRFQAVNTQSTRNWYDRLDAFYVPFAGFHDIERPGPNILVFERNTGRSSAPRHGSSHSGVSEVESAAPCAPSSGQIDGQKTGSPTPFDQRNDP
jgi:hypothetical protein